MVRPTYFDSNGLKKGAWSEEEDNKLRGYIQRYGHWNWRLLPKYAGLARCGKSCRLRWVNYLKPGMKHGNFSKHEEDLVIQLHNRLGNKWSAIAENLPGRTDNEIKNFWHTNIKKRNKRNLEGVETEKVIKEKINEPSEIIIPFKATDQIESNSMNFIKEHENSAPIFSNNGQGYDTNSSDSIAQTLDDFWTQPFVDTYNFPPLPDEEFFHSGLSPELYYSELSNFDSSFLSSLDWKSDDGISSSDGSLQSFVLNTSQETFSYFSSQEVEGEIYGHCFQYFDHGLDLF